MRDSEWELGRCIVGVFAHFLAIMTRKARCHEVQMMQEGVVDCGLLEKSTGPFHEGVVDYGLF